MEQVYGGGAVVAARRLCACLASLLVEPALAGPTFSRPLDGVPWEHHRARWAKGKAERALADKLASYIAGLVNSDMRSGAVCYRREGDGCLDHHRRGGEQTLRAAPR